MATPASACRGPGPRRPISLLALTLLAPLLGPVPAFAQTLFGPQQYTLTGPSPQTFSTVVSTTAGAAHLHVVNGAPDGSARLTHASITLNGVEVVSPEDLGANVALVDKPVFLFANNVLTITLTGPVGGTLEVTLERRSSALTSVTPSSGLQGETVPVTIVGSNTHFAQGTTLLFAGRGVSVGGAPPGEFGPVTVQDGTHLTATLTLGPSIGLGPRLLLAKTNGEHAALFPGLTVLAGTPPIPGTTVSTLAGTGTPGLVDGSGSTAQFRFPADVAPRADGSAVVADTVNSRLRALAPDGTTSTVSLPVSLLLPAGVTLDAAGRTVIADTARCVIRVVNANGSVTTIGSAFSCTFADGSSSTARFRFPRDVVSDATGTLYVADAGNHRVRKIDPQGTVTTLAGTGAFGGTDGPAASATFGLLTGIALAEQPQGPPTVLVSDAIFHKLRQIAPDGTVTTLAGTGVPGFADGPAATAQLAFPTRLTRDPAGHLYVADTLNNLIRRLTPQGTVETLAGTGAWGSQDGPGASATFTLPVGVGLASATPSTVFVADTFSHKLRVLQVGAAPTITGLDPTEAAHGQTIPLTVSGTNLTGATALTFLQDGTPDPAFTVTGLQGNPEGTQLQASVTIAATAALGPRTVTVTTPGGTSDPTPTPATTFTVLGQITLVPDFLSLVEGQQGSLSVILSVAPPPGGLTASLTSAAPGIATVPAAVTVPTGATSAPTTVTAVLEGTTNLTAAAPGFASGQSLVTVQAPVPTLTGFSPTSGKLGTAVTLTGTGFRLAPAANSVTFTGPNSTRVSAPVSAATDTTLAVTVPAGAITGPLQVTTSGGTATSSGHFVVLPAPDFTLSAVPATTSALQGGQATYALNVTGVEGFTGLVSLAVTGLPTGVNASLTPQFLAPGQQGTLTLQVGPGAVVGQAPVTLTGTATIEGASRSHSVGLTLAIEAGGRTALAGQFLTSDGVPLPGVQVGLGGVQATTDAAGAFVLLDIPAGTQMLSVDANVARPGFPIYGVDVTLTAGQTTVLPPFRITPPPPPERFTPFNNSAQDQIITDPRYPGVAITLPQGVTITGWDGTLKTQMAIERLSPDALPVPPPPGPTRSLYQVYFGTAMGGVPSAPLPVTLPNDLDLNPGEQAELWYYDAAPFPGVPAGWRLAGQGTVSADGQTIVSDPGVGIQRFCGVCGLVCWVRRQAGEVYRNLLSALGLDPVDLATGLFVVDKTDLLLPGRLPVTLSRSYHPVDPFAGIAGFEPVLGRGWYLSVDAILLPVNASLMRLVLPGNGRLEMVRQPDGTFRNITHPFLNGAVLSTLAGGDHQLRFKDGATWRFRQLFLGLEFLIEQADRYGNRITIQRLTSGRLFQIFDSAGRALQASYVGNRISQIRDPLGREVRYAYDGSGRLATVTDPAGGVTRYTYDSAGRITTITDPRDITFLTNTYSPGSGRVLTQTQADGGVWQVRYQLQGASVTGPGCPGSTCPTEESAERVAQGYTFSDGVIVATTVVDPRGNATRHRFAAGGFTSETTDPLGQSTRFERDAGGRLLSTNDPLGRITRFAYDAQGNVTSITDPVGNTRTFSYEPTFSKVTSIIDPLGNLTTFEYDTQGNLVAITDPEQNTNPEPAQRLKSRITYNSFGQPLTTTDPLGNVTTFAYDAQGNLATITDPLGNPTTRTYDLASRLLTQTDSREKVTRFAYDALNRLTQILDALGGETTFTYDGNGNLLTVSDARGSVITHTYDPMDRLATRTDPLNRAETFTYDGAGNLVSTTDRKGQTSTVEYDPLNRRVRSTFADGAIATFTYDAAGRLTLADDTADPHRPIAMAYDPLNRLLAETTALGTVTYQYDPLGRRTQMTLAGQAPVAYAYDAASRLTQLVQEPLAPVTLQYDAAGRRTLLTLPNQVSTEYQYDAASRLTALLYRTATGPLGDLTYEYDPAGNRVGVGGSFRRTLFPDPVPSATYDAANQQLTFGAKTMTFDANGNLTTLTDPTGTTTFTWNARSLLTAITGPTPASFAYDGFGRRIGKTINGTGMQYPYDGVNPVQELGPGSTTNLLTGLGIDEYFTRTDAVGTRSFLTDALGSTVALADSAGTLETQYTYAPFGQSTVTGAASTNPLAATGRELDGPTGLYFYRARYLSPTLHRFISEDRLHLLGGDINLYAYVWNSPTNFVDPLGLWGFGLTGGGIAAAGLGPCCVSTAATGSIGGGVFGGGSEGLNLGGFASAGAFAGGPEFGPSFPSEPKANFSLGGFAGASGGPFITNATSASDLEKTTGTVSLDIGIGYKFSIQISYGNGIWIGSATVGWGWGLALSHLGTKTWGYPRAK